MDWPAVFDESRPVVGASEKEVTSFASSIGRPLSADEIVSINHSQKNPFPVDSPLHAAYRPFDPTVWTLPSRSPPEDYLSLLRWSNGGWCRTGDREFGFFPALEASSGVRSMMLAYHVPQYMPGALPFAFNGGGTFYFLDMRQPPLHGSYPVVCAGAGALGWDRCWTVADSFEAACRGSTNVDDVRDMQAVPEIDPREPVAVYLERPLKSLRTLLEIKSRLGIATSTGELKERMKSIPCCLAEGLTYAKAIRCCSELNAVEPCLGIRLLSDRAVSLPLHLS